MKLGNKPNKIGTKNGSKFSFVFTYCSKSVHWEDLFDLLSSVFSEKKKLQGDFYQPMSRMLTEDDDYCFNVLVGEAERGTII